MPARNHENEKLKHGCDTVLTRSFPFVSVVSVLEFFEVFFVFSVFVAFFVVLSCFRGQIMFNEPPT